MFGLGNVKKSEHKEELEKLTAHFETTLGDFEIELFVKECPETVWNFVNLAEGRQETPAGPNRDRWKQTKKTVRKDKGSVTNRDLEVRR